jgi:hypothetical protein
MRAADVSVSVLTALGAMFLVLCSLAEAQQRLATARVGVLEPGYRPGTTRPGCSVGFRTGMRELGWIEGAKLQIEERHGEFLPERLQ